MIFNIFEIFSVKIILQNFILKFSSNKNYIILKPQKDTQKFLSLTKKFECFKDKTASRNSRIVREKNLPLFCDFCKFYVVTRHIITYERIFIFTFMTVKINPFVNCAANVKGFFSHYCNELG
jgi:hypothetical protein